LYIKHLPMKRLILFFTLATMFASCTLNSVDSNIKVINLTARAADWVPHVDGNGLNLYYSCTFDMPEFTSTFYDKGNVQTYYMMNGAQQALPYVRHYETNAAQWTRTVDFEYAVGSMTIFVTNSDFLIDPPVGMDFRVVMTW